MSKNNSLLYIIGIIAIIAVFGFVMVKSGSTDNSETYNAPIVDGLQEIVLGVKDFNYYPNTIKVQQGIPVRIYLDSSVSGCLRDFTVRDFGIHEYLKTSQDYVEFIPTAKGRHSFACSMNMGTGVLIVE